MGMEKRIVLVDRYTSIVDEILKDESVTIVMLIVDLEKQREKYKNNPRIQQVYTLVDLDHYDSLDGLDLDIIRKCKGAQLEAENALTRYIDDYHIRKFYYYKALSFWNKVFKNNHVDVAIIFDISHGLLYDGVMKGVAKEYGVPSYTCNGYEMHWENKFIWDENNDCMIPVENDGYVSSFEHYLTADDGVDVLNFKFDENIEDRDIIHRLIYRFFGALGLETVSRICHGRFFKEFSIASQSFPTTTPYRLRCYRHFKDTEKFLRKHEKTVDLSVPYIFFPLHFEPEGSIQTRMTLEEQLTVIQMLSQAAPDGWKVYVKEHPHQFKVNTAMFEYHINNIDIFKNKAYYKTLLDMKNVELISSDYSSQEIVKHCKAIAGLCGSALTETIAQGKPMLVFTKKNPLVNDDQVLRCWSYQELEDNIKKIEEGFVPDYSDTLKIINDYVTSDWDSLVKNVRKLIPQE